MPSHGPEFILLTWVLTKFTYLSILSILEMTCNVSSRIYNMLKGADFAETDAKKVKLGSYDGAWYSEYNGVVFI